MVNEPRDPKERAQPGLTPEILDKALAAIAKQGSVPRHDCRYDGHILQWNPLGFAWCVYCHKSEADLERPSA